jgi:intraflagellar transport protein 88
LSWLLNNKNMAALKNVHLAREQEEDDLYKGYDDFQLDDLGDDPEFQRVITTQHGRYKRPPLPPSTGQQMGTSGFRLGTGANSGGGAGRLTTGYAMESGFARPMTSTGAAGFSRGITVCRTTFLWRSPL